MRGFDEFLMTSPGVWADYLCTVKSPTSLPPDRAFLVRLDREADPGRGRLSGRVEHLQSGRRARMASLEELREFIFRVLGGEHPGAGEETPAGSARSRPEEEE